MPSPLTGTFVLVVLHVKQDLSRPDNIMLVWENFLYLTKYADCLDLSFVLNQHYISGPHISELGMKLGSWKKCQEHLLLSLFPKVPEK